jgi:pimeloyl-[acyl-carrier protein] methyl ester esterase
MAYADAGNGRPLLLVHGWGANQGFFAAQTRALESGFRVITLDLRGHGASPCPEGAPSVERIAADVCALADHLGLEDVLAVGWSMGAMVLWRALLSGLAERLTGMAVVDMTPRIVNDADWSLGLKGGYDSGSALAAQQAMIADWPGFAAVLARAVVAEGLDAERRPLIDWVAGEVALNDPRPLAHLWGSLTAQDFRADLQRFDLPTLIIHGARSQLYAADTSLYLEARLPDARRITFERSGHAPHLEEPDRFNRVITEFAATLAGRDQRKAMRRASAPPQP